MTPDQQELLESIRRLQEIHTLILMPILILVFALFVSRWGK